MTRTNKLVFLMLWLVMVWQFHRAGADLMTLDFLAGVAFSLALIILAFMRGLTAGIGYTIVMARRWVEAKRGGVT